MKAAVSVLLMILIELASPAVETSKTEAVQKLDVQTAAQRESELKQLGRDWGTQLAGEPTNQKLLPQELTTYGEQKTFILAAVTALAEISLEHSLKMASNLPTGQIKRLAYVQIVRAWSAKDPAIATDWSLQNLTAATRRDAVTQAAAVWAAQNPKSAAQWVVQKKGHPGEVALIVQEIALVWAQSAPTECAAWCESLPPGALQDQAMGAMVSEWATRAPKDAAKWTQSSDHQWLFPRVAHSWAQIAPLEAAEWIAREMAFIGLDSVVLTWADEAPEECLDWCLVKLPDRANELAEQVMRIWGNDAPEEAFKWIVNEPNTQLAVTAAREAISAWVGDSKTELADIGTWIGRLPQGPVRDVCYEQLSYALNTSFPIQSLTLAQKIQSKTLMNQTTRNMFFEWRKRDPLLARDWLRENPDIEKIIYSSGEINGESKFKHND
jgi:hypothetical protein